MTLASQHELDEAYQRGGERRRPEGNDQIADAVCSEVGFGSRPADFLQDHQRKARPERHRERLWPAASFRDGRGRDVAREETSRHPRGFRLRDLPHQIPPVSPAVSSTVRA